MDRLERDKEIDFLENMCFRRVYVSYICHMKFEYNCVMILSSIGCVELDLGVLRSSLLHWNCWTQKQEKLYKKYQDRPKNVVVGKGILSAFLLKLNRFSVNHIYSGNRRREAFFHDINSISVLFEKSGFLEDYPLRQLILI